MYSNTLNIKKKTFIYHLLNTYTMYTYILCVCVCAAGAQQGVGLPLGARELLRVQPQRAARGVRLAGHQRHRVERAAARQAPRAQESVLL